MWLSASRTTPPGHCVARDRRGRMMMSATVARPSAIASGVCVCWWGVRVVLSRPPSSTQEHSRRMSVMDGGRCMCVIVSWRLRVCVHAWVVMLVTACACMGARYVLGMHVSSVGIDGASASLQLITVVEM